MNTYNIVDCPQKGVKQSEKYGRIIIDNREGKYPVADGTFALGDLRSSVAVVLPTPDSSLEILSIEHGAAIAGSVNTSSLGIEYIVANIVGNPNIRNIVVFGKDGPSFHPGQSLINLKEFGADGHGFVAKTDDKWDARVLHLDEKTLERFRTQIVNAVDLLDEEDSNLLANAVYACIQEPEKAKCLTTAKGKRYTLYDPGPLNNEPLYPKIAVGKPGGIYDKIHDPLSSLIIAEDISQAYSLLWSNVRSQGRPVPSQFGPTIELLNCVVHIKDPLKNYLALVGDKSKQICDERISNYMYEDAPITQKMLKEFLDRYFETLLAPKKMKVFLDKSTGNYQVKDDPDAKYTYGERLRGYKYRDTRGNMKTRDNLWMIIQALANSIRTEPNTRRAMVSLIDPVFDLTIDLEDVDPPCITTLYFNPRSTESNNWILHGTMVMRSHDVRRAFVANAYAFAKLTEYICSQINALRKEHEAHATMGSITIFFVSAHEYISSTKIE